MSHSVVLYLIYMETIPRFHYGRAPMQSSFGVFMCQVYLEHGNLENIFLLGGESARCQTSPICGLAHISLGFKLKVTCLFVKLERLCFPLHIQPVKVHVTHVYMCTV